jgi:hypothetical protein
MKHWDSGLRLRTFFSRQPHVPEEQFNQGYAYAVRQGLDKKFRENDQYLWVLLEDLRASVAARGQGFRDTAGAVHHLQLFPGFCNTLTSPGYVELMGRLP